MDPKPGLTPDEVEMIDRHANVIPRTFGQVRQLIADQHEKVVATAARQVKDKEKEQRRKKNKKARTARRQNRR